MLTTQAAARSKDVAFAINSSGFMGPLWKTILYQGAAMLRAAGKPDSAIEEALAFNRFWMRVAQTGAGYDEFVARRDVARPERQNGLALLHEGRLQFARADALGLEPYPCIRFLAGAQTSELSRARSVRAIRRPYRCGGSVPCHAPGAGGQRKSGRHRAGHTKRVTLVDGDALAQRDGPRRLR